MFRLGKKDLMNLILFFEPDFAAVNATRRTDIWAMVTYLAVAFNPMTGGFCIQILSRREKTRSEPVRIVKSFLKDPEPLSMCLRISSSTRTYA